MIEKILSNSLKNHKTVTIIYIKDAQISQRRIRVMKIEDDYIKAIDQDKKSFRTFKIKNILSAR